MFVRAQVAWHQSPTSPLETLIEGARRARDQQLQGQVDMGVLEFGVAMLAGVATVASWRMLPFSYALLSSVLYLAVLSSGTTLSVWRYVYLIFPLFMVGARAGASTLFDRTYLTIALIGSGLLLATLATSWSMVT